MVGVTGVTEGERLGGIVDAREGHRKPITKACFDGSKMVQGAAVVSL
jgi:hypothetical protein